MAGTIDSKGWTGEPSPPPPPPPSLNPMPPLRPPLPWRGTGAPVRSPRFRAKRHAALAIVAPFLLAGAAFLLKLGISDLWITAPDVWLPVTAASTLGCLLYALAEFDILPRLVRWVAFAAWPLAVAAAFGYIVLGASAYGAAREGPVLRALVAGVARGRGDSASASVFRLQDGSVAATYDQIRRPRACFAVRRLEGPNGFSWLRIVETSPPAGSGQLDWPIDGNACLAGATMASLRG
jgi:hypothetical protein